ncbi:MAG: 30S ribosomal protein S12 methylthiotransferase RimO [Clostridia bacterium]|nr:30S ribosomal protein S12 methylthiotransferase RimO [Clostridia bacterium]
MKTMVKVGMVSLGCPKNQMDAELMLAKLEAAGFTITAESGLADVVIVNTCGFIEDAKREAIENILEFAQLKKEGQIKKLIVTGCLAQRYQQELCAELPECDAVLGLGANADIVTAVREVLNGDTVASFPDLSCWQLDGDRLQTTPHFFAYLRIGDGCNNRCAYCAIPSIRGPLRSREMDAVLAEARVLAKNGVKELVLVAQDTTLYGADKGGESQLPELLEKLCEIDGIRWIRLLYCYPEHVTDKLLTVMAKYDKIVKYMDLPIQHASGKVLKAMNRPGNCESLTALMAHVREMVPDIVLRTTVMTGFPGETEEDFEQLCAFIKDVRFERLGCFAFSPEEGTPAAVMDNQVSDDVKEHRRDVVMELQSRIAASYQEAQVGTVKEVLVESFDQYAECWFGRTTGDAPDIDGKVFFTTKKRVQPGDIVPVRITEAMDWDLVGECI